MKNILIIEDDQSLRKTLCSSLSGEYICIAVSTLAQAYEAFEVEEFDLVIVDRVLPDGDGLELIEYLHDTSYQTKIIALTGKGQVFDRIEGLEKGADEYLPKPFSLAELKLKVGKLLRMEKKTGEEVLRVGSLEFHPYLGMLKIKGREVQLRKREAEILHCLFRYKNQIVTREMIIDDVWSGAQTYPSSTTLDVYIRRIRVVLREYNKLITTIRGFGYKFTDSAVAHR